LTAMIGMGGDRFFCALFSIHIREGRTDIMVTLLRGVRQARLSDQVCALSLPSIN
jgi:hypothetical protein